MDEFLKNRTFEVELTLNYNDTGLPIDLSTLDEIEVVVKKTNGGPILVTKKLSLSEVVIKTALSGICAIYINKADTVNAEEGQYDYIVTIEDTDANYTDTIASIGGFGRCFKLINVSQPL